jgi:hypothetical protein
MLKDGAWGRSWEPGTAAGENADRRWGATWTGLEAVPPRVGRAVSWARAVLTVQGVSRVTGYVPMEPEWRVGRESASETAVDCCRNTLWSS